MLNILATFAAQYYIGIMLLMKTHIISKKWKNNLFSVFCVSDLVTSEI